MLLLLGLIVAVFLKETRLDVELARTARSDARAEALADAGVHWAMAALLTADERAAVRADGQSYEFALDGGLVRVAVQDEGGKIDLNRASEDVLRALFRWAGRDDRGAVSLAAALADFRDSDHEARPGGAEDDDYARTGRSIDAKDAPLTTIDELQQVLGMTPELFRLVEPHITVHSPRRDVDTWAASAEVLGLLPYVTEDARQALLDSRRNGARQASVSTATIVVDAETDDGGRFLRRAVVRRSASPLQPFDVLDWRRTWPAE